MRMGLLSCFFLSLTLLIVSTFSACGSPEGFKFKLDLSQNESSFLEGSTGLVVGGPQQNTLGKVTLDLFTWSSLRASVESENKKIKKLELLYGLSKISEQKISALDETPRTKVQWFLSGLKADTSYVICPHVQWEDGTWSSCDDNANTYTIRTSVRGRSTPSEPANRASFSDQVTAALPEINGQTYLVSNDCADLQDKINLAATQDPNKNHQILIPSGTDCTPFAGQDQDSQLIFPQRAEGSGEIIIRTSAKLENDIRPDGRIQKSHYAQMPILRNAEIGLRVLGGPPDTPCTQGQLWWKYPDNDWSLHRCRTTGQNDWDLVSFTRISRSATSCTANTWYRANDSRPAGEQILWCGPDSKLYPIKTGRNHAFSIAKGAHHYRFFGIRFLPVPVQQWTTAVYSDATYFVGFFYLDKDSHHITFDRINIDGLDFPQRVQNGIYSNGSDVLIRGARFERLSFGIFNPGDFGCNPCTSSVFQFPEGKRITFFNNFTESAGIQIFASDDGQYGPSDVIIKKNTITKPLRYLYQSAENITQSASRVYLSRHSLELKRGQRVWISGNIFDTNFATVARGEMITISPRPNANTMQVSDVTIENNIIARSPTAITVIGHNDYTYAQPGITARVLIRNNIITGVSNKYAAPNTGARGLGNCFILYLGGEDIAYENNFCDVAIGTWPAYLWMQENFFSGLRFNKNIVHQQWSEGYGGAVYPGKVAGTESLEFGTQGDYQFNYNVIAKMSSQLMNYPATNQVLDGNSSLNIARTGDLIQTKQFLTPQGELIGPSIDELRSNLPTE